MRTGSPAPGSCTAEARLAVPTTYGNVDDHLVVLLEIAARYGLVLVDLDAQKVDRPGPSEPVGVKAAADRRFRTTA